MGIPTIERLRFCRINTLNFLNIGIRVFKTFDLHSKSEFEKMYFYGLSRKKSKRPKKTVDIFKVLDSLLSKQNHQSQNL